MLDVLHVIPLLWSGAGRVLTRLCEVQAADLRVGIVTAGSSRGERDWPEYRRCLKNAGVRHTTIDFFDRDSATFWTGVRRLASVIGRERPAVVHTHAGVPAAAAALARSMTAHRCRIVAHFYSWGVGRPGWMDDMDLWGFRQADHTICSSVAYANLLSAGGVPPRRLSLIPWGVDLGPARRTLPGRGQPLTIGFVGRLEPRKRQLELVRVVSALRRCWPDIRLDLVGPSADEAYEREIRRAVRTTGTGRVVRLLGKVKDPSRYVASWDLFVSVSSDEGQGMAVLEAMQCGTPVAAAMVAGIEDFVAAPHAIPLPARATLPAVTKRLRDALGRPDFLVEVGRAGRAYVDRKYQWHTTARRIRRLYGPSLA